MACVLFGVRLEGVEQDQSQRREDKEMAAILKAISKTSPEGKQIIEKAQYLCPEVNGIKSAWPLIVSVNDYTSNKGAYNLHPVGWEAFQRPNERWRVVFHYRTYNDELMSAEWEYDPESGKLYSIDKNAAAFWSNS